MILRENTEGRDQILREIAKLEASVDRANHLLAAANSIREQSSDLGPEQLAQLLSAQSRLEASKARLAQLRRELNGTR